MYLGGWRVLQTSLTRIRGEIKTRLRANFNVSRYRNDRTKGSTFSALSVRPSIGPWVPSGYLRLTDSLALRVERTVATNHARKPAFLCSGKRLAFFSAGDNFDLLVTTGKRDGMRKLGREREVKGDRERSIPSTQWKKDVCESEE